MASLAQPTQGVEDLEFFGHPALILTLMEGRVCGYFHGTSQRTVDHVNTV